MKKLALGCLIITGTIVSSWAYASNDNYAIIVDAGSSGSRLHLFRYSTDRAMPVITEVFSEKTSPGLSSYSSHPSDAGPSFQNLINDATSQLLRLGVNPSKVPLSIRATAGMRLLLQATQDAIYANVGNYFQTHSKFAYGYIGTISGQMEGLYGWLDVNYLTKAFENLAPTVGSIDMGGASTQIAFATADTSRPNEIIKVRVNGLNYSVFSASFLGLGQDQSLSAMLANPNNSSCYPTGYTDNQVKPGTFNYEECNTIYNNVIAAKNVLPQLITLANQSFIAYSGAYYDYNFLGVDKTPDAATVKARIESICSLSWDQLRNEYPTQKYLATECANNIFLSDLFYNTYQLQGSQLNIDGKINNQDLDWTIGAMLYDIVTDNAK